MCAVFSWVTDTFVGSTKVLKINIDPKADHVCVIVISSFFLFCFGGFFWGGVVLINRTDRRNVPSCSAANFFLIKTETQPEKESRWEAKTTKTANYQVLIPGGAERRASEDSLKTEAGGEWESNCLRLEELHNTRREACFDRTCDWWKKEHGWSEYTSGRELLERNQGNYWREGWRAGHDSRMSAAQHSTMRR